MLYPAQTQSRQCISLNGIWDFTLLEEQEPYDPFSAMENGLPMPVLCSYNDIYEGDIVKFDDEEIAEVVFFCGAFMTSLKKGESVKIDYDAKPIWQDGEIIGNIFENKELL